MRWRYSLVLLICLLASRLSAQETPEAVAETLSRCLRDGDWAGAAHLMHPEALGAMRTLFAPLMTGSQADENARQLFGLGSAAELASTPDTVVFAHFLQSVTARAGLDQALKGAQFTALGHVMGGGDTVLVVSHLTMTLQGITLSSFEVMPFVLYEGHYRGLLKADFTNMAAVLKARLGRSQ